MFERSDQEQFQTLDRQQEMAEVAVCEAKLEKERKKYCGTKIRRQEKEKQNILLRKVQTIRHSW